MIKFLKRLTPNFLKQILKSTCPFLFSGRDSTNNMIPPSSMIFIGSGDFERIGQEFITYFIELAELKPSDRVLDVGCGIGRMAIPLTSYLSEKGDYYGFDIVKEGIEWCQKHITPTFKNFHFQHSDIYNKHYNKNGKTKADKYQFPFDDNYYDFVFLTSVFTHMLPADMENYLSEISRVLKPMGKCLITYFLLNDESEKLILSGKSTLDFSYEIQGCKTINKDDPEAAIAYQESFILELYQKYVLNIELPIQYGSWCSRETYLSYQDLIVAQKYSA